MGLMLEKRSVFINVPLILEPESRRITLSRLQLCLGFDVTFVAPFLIGCHLRVGIHSIQRSGQHFQGFSLRFFGSAPLVVLFYYFSNEIYCRDGILQVFRYSIVFWVVLQSLINTPVLLRGGIFQVKLGNNVSRFSTAVSDNIPSSLLYKTCLGGF